MSGKKDWIQTRSGKKFYPLEPDPGVITVEDIAHALSNMCRYTGHCSTFYSVAEHSVWVSRVVEERAPGQLWLARWGLIHDATEAYIADVSRPLKHQAAFDEYRKVEAALQEVIAAKFGLPPGEPPLVKQVDTEMLGTEVAQLMQPLHPDWGTTTADGKLADPIASVGQLGLVPRKACEFFMERFRELRF
jgi:hypothetical protein